jgi:photosystem II stability/assembly factor-like uncharacterized protein
MRKSIPVILLAMAVSFSLHAQRGWTLQSSGVTYDLYDVSFVDALHGWAVGESNMILRTTDGGTTWQQQSSGASQYTRFWTIAFVDDNIGWAGDILAQGVYHTEDGGATWGVVDLSPYFTFYAVFFLDHSTGWAGGWDGALLHTTDGGDTWTYQNTETNKMIFAICFADENNGWIAGESGTLLHTTDGGSVWTQQDAGTNFFIYGIWFIDAQTGWVGSTDGTIHKTTDGGASWTQQYSGEASILDIWFADAQKGWATAGAYVLHTENGGQNWSSQSTVDDRELWRLSFINDQTGWVVGAQGKIAFTSNGGLATGDELSKTKLSLHSYPNPFTTETTISYSLPATGHVRLSISDIRGKVVSVIADEQQPEGRYERSWNGRAGNGRQLRNGIYFCRIELNSGTGTYSEVQKMLFIGR